MNYQKKCLRCGAVTKAERWPGEVMHKTKCAEICKEITTHHFKEKAEGKGLKAEKSQIAKIYNVV